MRNLSVINRIAVATATSFAILAAPLALQAETPSIEKIAPENTLLILGTRNGAQAFENLKKTPLWTMWQSDKMQTMRADAMKQMDEGLAEMFKELGVEEDALHPPTGSVGVALFTVPDPDLGVPQLSVMAVGDWGENAEKMDALVKAALAKGVTDEKISFEEKDVAGRNVHVIDLSKLRPEEPEEDEARMPMEVPLPDPDDLVKGMTKMHYLRDGSTIMLCSDLTALTDALDAIDGKADEARSFAQRKDFQETLALVGSESDGYGVLLTRDIMDVVAAGNPMMAMAKPITRLVVGEVAGYGVALRFDADGAIAQQTVGVFMPEGKAGLTELLDRPAPRGSVPGFAAAGSLSYSSFNFDFSGVMNVIKTALTSLPFPGAAEGIPEMEKNLGPILAALGSKVHSASMNAGGKQQGVLALECKDPQSFENAFGAAAGQGGLEARDFLGQRIYTMEGDMTQMMPVVGGGMGGESLSIGIGGGHVFIGPTPSVEQALRTTGQPDAAGAGLAQDEMFQRATNFLGNEPVVAWGYIDTIASAEAGVKRQEETMREAIEQMKEFDPETAAEMEKDLAAQAGAAKDFDPAFFKQYIGPSTWKMTSSDKGFVLNFYTLPAAN
jgi:hypothetical protein